MKKFARRLHSNNPNYAKWITDNVGDCFKVLKNGFIYTRGAVGRSSNGEPLIQRCDEAAPAMAKHFPELIHYVGSYMHPVLTSKYWMYHHWLEDALGFIVDPTGRQFDTVGNIDGFKIGGYYHGKKAPPNTDSTKRGPASFTE